MWILGISEKSALFAASQGAKFALAHFLLGKSSKYPPPTVTYQKAFNQKFGKKERPYVSIAVEAFCASSKEDIAYSTASRNLNHVHNSFNVKNVIGFWEPRKAIKYSFKPEEAGKLNNYINLCVDGGPEEVSVKLAKVASDYEADEILILTNCYSLEERKRSYRLIAVACQKLQ